MVVLPKAPRSSALILKDEARAAIMLSGAPACRKISVTAAMCLLRSRQFWKPFALRVSKVSSDALSSTSLVASLRPSSSMRCFSSFAAWRSLQAPSRAAAAATSSPSTAVLAANRDSTSASAAVNASLNLAASPASSSKARWQPASSWRCSSSSSDKAEAAASRTRFWNSWRPCSGVCRAKGSAAQSEVSDLMKDKTSSKRVSRGTLGALAALPAAFVAARLPIAKDGERRKPWKGGRRQTRPNAAVGDAGSAGKA
mmetsp:Transcript_60928/g.176265  ORF Transcript_60928/g.176265 Transcript_60928/m.176265 type:complete len:256 (-) Transcript_60928:1-768(-)